ncbi:MAG: hypothetical protein MUF31_06210 [Akkermansiaceae bacterium]|nr:hypothetical protein [Akkermansiaceae bacterium]
MADALGDGIERMTLKGPDGEEILFVKESAILTEADVENAWATEGFGGEISVRLTEAGGKKLKASTEKMRHGQDRLALVIDGKLFSAPIVQAALGSNFSISGSRDMDFPALQSLADRIAGRPKDDQEAAPERPDNPSLPYTEEEYRELKVFRERIGIHYIDTLPLEDDLKKQLRQGITPEKVAEIFGKPTHRSERAGNDPFYWIYDLAPERLPENPKREMIPSGIKVDFSEGKLSMWSYTYSNSSRKHRLIGREAATLKIVLPEIDLSKDDVNFITFLEAIEIPTPEQNLTTRDFQELLSLADALPVVTSQHPEKPSIDGDCDFIELLSNHFPEVATLRKQSQDGRVSCDALSKVLGPYLSGEKALPIKTQKGNEE